MHHRNLIFLALATLAVAACNKDGGANDTAGNDDDARDDDDRPRRQRLSPALSGPC